MSELLRIENLHVSYGPYKALFGVSFTIEENVATALVGPNGAGKSTTVRALAGLIRPISGKIYFQGKDITELAPWQRIKLGMAFSVEGRSVFSTLTVEENLKLDILAHIKNKKQLPEILERAYDLFPHLAARRAQVAGSLSGGEQKMLALVAALVLNPKLFVADEISLGLAPVTLEMVFTALERLKENRLTLLVVEQKLDRILKIADQVIFMDKGKVAAATTAEHALEVAKALTV